MTQPHDPQATSDHTPGHGTSSSRTATSPDGQTANHPSAPRHTGATPEVPGYELLGELGRGGMGVVYKARHLALKRVVALKMVLAGGHAGEGERARFRSEAEAVARLSHPGIVQVFEVGEHDGCPYCALEFVEGGSLAQKLAGKPVAPEEAAKQVVMLAQAMHLAHSRNIVHRDLKPANVLVGADGALKVTDFGLARRIDQDSGMTQAGAVMGTPSYMAPEQASGLAHAAGPAADVYALGAILYECLTGQPPFRAGDLLQTLELVRTQDPVPPGRMRPGVPADLETVCLKCLAKEPERRYGSAQELADELGRFLRGEPVLARPVGWAERAWRWCRRNPALSAALTAVALLLVVGATVGTALAVIATNARGDAEREAKEANDARADLARAFDELRASSNRLEQTAARGLLRPLGLNPGPFATLADAEAGALMELAGAGSSGLRIRFLSEALRRPDTIRQLRHASQYALHAAVGLSQDRREKAEELLVKALAREKDKETKVHLAVALARLGAANPGHVSHLLRAMKQTDDSGTLLALAEGVAGLAPSLGRPEATRACAEASESLLRAVPRATDANQSRELGEAAVALSSHMGPAEARKACTRSAEAMFSHFSTIGFDYGRWQLARGLAVAWKRIDAEKAAAQSARATGAVVASLPMGDLSNPVSAAQAVEALTAASSALQGKEVAAAIIDLMNKVKQPDGLAALAVRLAEALPPDDASDTAPKAAARLIEAMKLPTTPLTQRHLVRGLVALAGRLRPAPAREAASSLVALLGQPVSFESRLVLSEGLAALAPRMEPDEAVALLAPHLASCNHVPAIEALAGVLETAARRASPAKSSVPLLEALGKAEHPWALRALARSFAAVAQRLDPGEKARLAAQAVEVLSGRMGKTPDGPLQEVLAEGLVALSGCLPPAEAAGLLEKALTGATQPHPKRALAKGLAGAAARLGVKNPAVLVRAAKALARSCSGERAPYHIGILAQALGPLAEHLGKREQKVVVGRVENSIARAGQGIGSGELQALALGVVALKPRLGKRAADALVARMAETKEPFALAQMADGLLALGERMEPGEAAEVAARAAAGLDLGGPGTIGAAELARGLAGLSGKMRPLPALRLLAKALEGPRDAAPTEELLRAAVRAAARLSPAKAMEGGQLLLGGMRRNMNPLVKAGLGEAVAAAAGRLGQEDASALCLPAASLLSRDLVAFSSVGNEPTRAALVKALEKLLSAPLSDQGLADALKGPFCVGGARRMVLGRLAARLGRPFADQWEFARFAREKGLGLDLDGPPAQPSEAK